VLYRKLEHGSILRRDGLDREDTSAKAVVPRDLVFFEQITENIRIVHRDAEFCSCSSQVWQYTTVIGTDAKEAVGRLLSGTS
jgi:hypothetical protein